MNSFNKKLDVINMEVGTEETMQDGTKGYLSNSKNYFIRREPNPENWTEIRYYKLTGERILLAKAMCDNCGEIVESKHCGDFQSCYCGESFVDTDRWMPERQRFGGLAKDLNK